VARAKGTDRAEARRRYRAIVKAQEDAEAGTEAPSTAAPSAARNRGRGPQTIKPAPSQVAQRPGFFGAAKGAYRPVHYREDLQFVVPLVTRTFAVWPVLVLTIIAVPLALSRPNVQGDPILGFLAFWLSPTPLLPAMIAGFLAPRATWLAGAINGLIVGTGLIVFLAVANGQIIGGEKIAPSGLLAASVQILVYAVPFGAFLAAGTGWYKRFLAAMPGTAPRQQQRRKTK
jgi:hypothetical protein